MHVLELLHVFHFAFPFALIITTSDITVRLTRAPLIRARAFILSAILNQFDPFNQI